MDEHLFQPVPEELPSPDELFHTNPSIEGTVSVSRREPIPRYRVVKRVSAAFVIFILILILAVFGLKQLGYQFYYMRSHSMQSMIPDGSFLFERKVKADEIENGDVITYINREGISVTHQVVRIREDYKDTKRPAFRTKGVDNQSSDDEMVTEDMIQGRVIFYIPYLGGLLAKLKLA